MNKTQLVASMAAITDLSKVDLRKAVDAFVDVTTGSLKNNERIALIGFGSFELIHRKERNGRNPQTGAGILIPAKKTVRFKAGSDLSSQIQ